MCVLREKWQSSASHSSPYKKKLTQKCNGGPLSTLILPSGAAMELSPAGTASRARLHLWTASPKTPRLLLPDTFAIVRMLLLAVWKYWHRPPRVIDCNVTLCNTNRNRAEKEIPVWRVFTYNTRRVRRKKDTGKHRNTTNVANRRDDHILT